MDDIRQQRLCFGDWGVILSGRKSFINHGLLWFIPHRRDLEISHLKMSEEQQDVLRSTSLHSAINLAFKCFSLLVKRSQFNHRLYHLQLNNTHINVFWSFWNCLFEDIIPVCWLVCVVLCTTVTVEVCVTVSSSQHCHLLAAGITDEPHPKSTAYVFNHSLLNQAVLSRCLFKSSPENIKPSQENKQKHNTTTQ